MPRSGQVLGLVGTNGIGKSTALKILGGKQKPNLGNFADPPDWADILVYFRGSELQNYFTKILEDNLKVGRLTKLCLGLSVAHFLVGAYLAPPPLPTPSDL